MSETHPNAFKAEAEEMRRQAHALLSNAEALDPTPVEKPKKVAEKSAPKKKKNTKK